MAWVGRDLKDHLVPNPWHRKCSEHSPGCWRTFLSQKHTENMDFSPFPWSYKRNASRGSFTFFCAYLKANPSSSSPHQSRCGFPGKTQLSVCPPPLIPLPLQLPAAKPTGIPGLFLMCPKISDPLFPNSQAGRCHPGSVESLEVLSHPWKCPRPGWTELGAPWDSGRHPCPWQGVEWDGI